MRKKVQIGLPKLNVMSGLIREAQWALVLPEIELFSPKMFIITGLCITIGKHQTLSWKPRRLC